MSKIGVIGKDVSLEVLFTEVLEAKGCKMQKGVFIGFDEQGEARMWTNQLMDMEILYLAEALLVKVQHDLFRGTRT